MKTFFPSGDGLRTEGKKWVIIDAESMVLGRLASYVVHLLKGKASSCYTPFMDCGDNVIVVNASKIVIKGKNRMKQRVYYRHTGYMGGLKSTTAHEIITGRFPERLLLLAVKRMNGIGPLARQRLRNLHVYAGPEHRHQAQQPVSIDFGSMNRKNKIIIG